MSDTATFGSAALADTFGTYKKFEVDRQLRELTQKLSGSTTAALMGYKVPPTGVLQVVQVLCVCAKQLLTFFLDPFTCEQAVLALLGFSAAEYTDWQNVLTSNVQIFLLGLEFFVLVFLVRKQPQGN